MFVGFGMAPLPSNAYKEPLIKNLTLNRYTTAIGMSSWRFFNVGKYKNQKVKDVCYFNPFYVAWCLENWQGFSLTSYERSNYMKGLERQLEKDPEDQELILKVSKCKTIA